MPHSIKILEHHLISGFLRHGLDRVYSYKERCEMVCELLVTH